MNLEFEKASTTLYLRNLKCPIKTKQSWAVVYQLTTYLNSAVEEISNYPHTESIKLTIKQDVKTLPTISGGARENKERKY